MAVAFCTCPSGRDNLGTLACASTMKTIKKHIFMDEFNSDGERNSIQLTDLVDGVLPDAFVLDKINETDPTKRWYFTPDSYENVEGTRTDPTTEEFQSGRIEKIQDGVRQFQGVLLGLDSTFASRLASNSCGDTAVYEVAIDGSLRGEVSEDGSQLYPMVINQGSLIAIPVEEVEGTSVAKIQLNFQYSQLVDEGALMILQAAQIETDLLKCTGLIDGIITVLDTPAITNATVNVTLTYAFYGSFGVSSFIQGQDNAADWDLKDGVTPVVISGVVDLNGDGSEYEITFTSTPTSDLTLDYIGIPTLATEQGFDIPKVEFTTPV